MPDLHAGERNLWRLPTNLWTREHVQKYTLALHNSNLVFAHRTVGLQANSRTPQRRSIIHTHGGLQAQSAWHSTLHSYQPSLDTIPPQHGED